MSTSRVTQLGYLGIEVSNLPDWEEYATTIIGLEPTAIRGESTLLLRLDENHHRIALHTGVRDDLTSVGWEAYDEDRWKSVGLVEPALLAVVHTSRGNDGEVIRLISARKADAHERAQYREV